MTMTKPAASVAPSPGTTGVKQRTKHSALTEQLQELVTSLRPGDRLPNQDELMDRYRVSDSTVLRSLEDLRRAGWIVRQRGRGTYVADPRERATTSGVQSAPDIIHSPATSNTITVLAPHFFAASYLRLCADLLARQTEAQGLTLVCRVTPYSAAAPSDVMALENPKPRGFILLGYPMAGIAKELMARGHSAVIVGTPPVDVDAEVPCVCADHEFGGALAARHLIEWGHRRLAFAYDGHMRYPYERHPRWAGHQSALQEAQKVGLSVQNAVITSDMLNAWREDASLAAAYFQKPDAPTGIAAWNDSAAIMLLGILHRAGLRVPDDISVIGFDALPEGIDSIPPLTTVDQHVDWQIQIALRLLSRATPLRPQATIVVPELKRRSSCGPPPLTSAP